MESYVVGASWRVPKMHESMEDCQDSIAFSLENQVFCIADGATQSFQSGLWSRTLTSTFIKERELLYFNNWKQWIEVAQVEWLDSVNKLLLELKAAGKSTWIELANGLAERRPAASTFVGLRIIGKYIHGICLGDSCALFFRLDSDNSGIHQQIKLVSIYPNKYSDRFTSRAKTFLSYDEYMGNEPSIFQVPVPDDCSFIILATDSLAEYIIDSLDGDSLTKEMLKRIISSHHGEFVSQARSEGMKNDDTSLLLIYAESSDFFFNLDKSLLLNDRMQDSVEKDPPELRQRYYTSRDSDISRASELMALGHQYTESSPNNEYEHLTGQPSGDLNLITNPQAILSMMDLANSRSPIDNTPKSLEGLASELASNSDTADIDD